MGDIGQTIELATSISSKALLVLALVGGFRRWYVWGWAYDALIVDRNEWRTMALKALHVAEKVTPAGS